MANYPETNSSPNFPEIEKKIQKFWLENNIFQKSVDALPPQKNSGKEFSFFDGPPFANGLPHYGHLLTSCVKDLYARYHTMLGERTERVFGWDCHGLPAEMEAEKELGIRGQLAIQEYGIEKFNNTCRTSVMKYTSEWKEYVNRVGRWVDFDNGYKTMDKNYMESVIWAFSELYKKGLVYEGHKVMPYSWAAETPLSNFETRLDNSYREKISKAITVAFELEGESAKKLFADSKLGSKVPLPFQGERLGEGMGINPSDFQYFPAQGKEINFTSDNKSATRRDDITLERASKLRKDSTESEKSLWNILRDRNLENYKFRRQHAIDNYIVDFVCVEEKLVVELDGSQHLQNAEYDKKRTEFLNSQGYSVLRFWNSEVLGNEEGVASVILGVLKTSTSPHLTSPLRRGEGFPSDNTPKIYVLAWTTTPWTLPSNLALAVNPSMRYRAVFVNDTTCYISSINSSTQLFSGTNDKGSTENAGFIFDGKRLLNLRYKPLLPYFDPNHPANADKKAKLQKQIGDKAFTILEGDFVSDADGTGIVHLAPGFGEDDQRVCQANGICLPENGGIICPVDEAGKFTSEIFDIPELKLQHLNVIAETKKSEDEPYKEDQLKKYGLANLRIVKYLKNKNQVIKEEDYKHNYPHCWRTDTPLIYKAVPSWYVKVTTFKDRMVELNQKINWIPEHIRDGQFGKWLENAHDWAISRNRFWGAPIPIWRSNNPQNKKLYVFGSIREIQDFFGVEVNDLHRPYIDELTKPDPENPQYTIKRVPEVLDCWFESGSMPFAEVHFPHGEKWKNGCRFSGHYGQKDFSFQPANFIVEYTAQTRGWFYTLMVLSTALFNEIPFKNCICHGVILGEPMKNPTTGAMEKQKLSKRLKNYPDPVEVFNTLGADAMRWMMISSPVMNGGELTISKSGDDIKEVVRLVLKPIWNAYHFFCLYANSDGIEAQINFKSENLLDRYILAKLKNAVEQIKTSLDAYNTATACSAVSDFFEVLNNWYIRRSRERFWESEKTENKLSAYNTLYTCLVTICQAASPLLPFLTEEIYKGLTGKESVHLEKFPDVSKIENHYRTPPISTNMRLIGNDANLTGPMDKARDICNVGLSIRSKENLRIRQPLAKVHVVGNIHLSQDYADIVKEELNVKEVEFSSDLQDKAELKLKINFPALGKRLPDKVKEIIPSSKQGKWVKLPDGRIKIAGEILEKDECELLLEPKDKKGAASLSTNDALVILDLNLTPELIEEGIARDVVRLIQQARKEADLDIANRIDLSLTVPESYKNAVVANSNYIQEQTLAVSLDLSGKKYDKFNNVYEIEKDKVEISFAVAS